MKKAIFIFGILFIALIFVKCGGGAQASNQSTGNWKTVEDPFKDLTVQANKMIEDGGIAAVGEGLSRRPDIAKQKAIADAQGKLAEIFSNKVNRLKKNYQEEVGQGKQSEVNELFSIAQTSFAQKVLIGATEKDSKTLTNDNGEYRVAVLVAITPKQINMSLMDEMSAGKPQLYQRFRSSQAFEELQKEIDKYEKEQGK